MTDEQKARLETARHDTARRYATLFLGSDDGRWVLADLLTKFPIDRTSFDLSSPEPLRAALKDGQRSVTIDLESAVRLGARLAGIPYERPC